MQKQKSFFIGSLVFTVVLLIVLGIVYGLQPVPNTPAPPAPPPTAAESGVPAFTSAKFADADPIQSLGPNWTLLRQNAASSGTSMFPGTMETRETLAKLVGGHTELMITEFSITDAGALQADLDTSSTTDQTIQGRTGKVIPVPSLGGESGFLLTGTSTALLLETGDDRYQQLMPWPEQVDPEIANYIWSVSVR